MVLVVRTESEWAEILEACEKSGQSRSAWCREHGINVKTMANHVYKKRNGVESNAKRSLHEWPALIDTQKSSGKNTDGLMGADLKDLRQFIARINDVHFAVGLSANSQCGI